MRSPIPPGSIPPPRRPASCASGCCAPASSAPAPDSASDAVSAQERAPDDDLDPGGFPPPGYPDVAPCLEAPNSDKPRKFLRATQALSFVALAVFALHAGLHFGGKGLDSLFTRSANKGLGPS